MLLEMMSVISRHFLGCPTHLAIDIINDNDICVCFTSFVFQSQNLINCFEIMFLFRTMTAAFEHVTIYNGMTISEHCRR